jgi:bacterioferritin (cytochrome b1)
MKIRKIGENKSDDKPGMYDSKLFARKHPNADGSQYSKSAEEVPDPDSESLEPDKEERPVDVASTMDKAISLLKSVSAVPETPEVKEPDTTGKLEGKFSIPLNKMIGWLNRLLAAEYSQWFRYYHYAMVLKGKAFSDIVGEFSKHAYDELEHANSIGSRILGLGGYPIPAIERPAPLKKLDEILKEMIAKEQEGMNLYRQILALCGDNEGTKQLIEHNISVEQEHIDDLWRFSKGEEVEKADMSAGKTTNPSEDQAKREYDNSFSRFPRGVAGGSTPDLPERGRDWHGTVPGVPDEPQDDEEEEKYFKDPVDLLKPKSCDSTDEAIKALAGAARFAAPIMPPREREFMLQNGYTEDEISNGATLTPRLRAEFNRYMAGSVRKSLSSLDRFGR